MLSLYHRWRFAGVRQDDLRRVNQRLLARMSRRYAGAEAFEQTIGGSFERIGRVQLSLLRRVGLQPRHAFVDVGCGAGRLAKPLSSFLDGPYLGIDVVPELVAHARRLCDRPDWRFRAIEHIGIPAPDASADFVCFFSVLTHLHHEQGYWYLEEARRVLKPGGRLVFSFLEFAHPPHREIFWDTLRIAKRRGIEPPNVFIERNVVVFWAEALGMELEHLIGSDEAFVKDGPLGQTCAVLRKPTA